MLLMYMPSIQQTLEQAIHYHQAGDLSQAEDLYRKVLSQDSKHPDALHLLGVLAFQSGHPQPGRQLIEQALLQRPDSVHYLSSLSQVLKALADDHALSIVYQRLLALEGPSAELYLMLGQVLGRLQRFQEAEQMVKQAIELEPANGWVWNSLGNLQQMQGHYSQAESSYHQAFSAGLASADVLNNLAVAQHEQSHFAQALTSWEQALALDSEHIECHINAGMSRLLQGDWQAGLEEYDVWRWKNTTDERRSFFATVPFWDGQPLSDQTLLIHAEQGFGDTLQFMRYLFDVQKRVNKFVLECQPELVDLLKQNYPDWVIISQDEPLPAFDVHVPLLSLPRVLGLKPDSQAVPYLQPRQALSPSLPVTSSPRIGLVWSSGSTAALRLYQKKSIALERFAPLFDLKVFDLKGLNWFSLQVGPDREMLLAGNYPLSDLSDKLTSFGETADVIAQLDLVISVDTAVAHLAGAMGKEVWMLLPKVPDWRWGLDSVESPWYPTMRLFRQQEADDWDGVLAELKKALIERSAQS